MIYYATMNKNNKDLKHLIKFIKKIWNIYSKDVKKKKAE